MRKPTRGSKLPANSKRTAFSQSRHTQGKINRWESAERYRAERMIALLSESASEDLSDCLGGKIRAIFFSRPAVQGAEISIGPTQFNVVIARGT
jgi:hypothetical protein